jgi:hypothetical protein
MSYNFPDAVVWLIGNILMIMFNEWWIFWRSVMNTNQYCCMPEFPGINSNAVCQLLGDSPASGLYWPTFRNPLSGPSSKAWWMKCEWWEENVVFIHTMSGFARDGRANGEGRHQVLGGSERTGWSGGGGIKELVWWRWLVYQYNRTNNMHYLLSVCYN